MPDLEAVTVIGRTGPVTTSGESVPPGEYSWRRELIPNRPVRLGRDSAECGEFAVPEDGMISRFHATLQWNGTELAVTRRGVLPDHPKPTQNQIYFRDEPSDQFSVRVGQSFVIGQTRFTLRDSAETTRAAPVDVKDLHGVRPRSRDELALADFSDRLILKALERLPMHLAAVADEAGLFKQLLRVLIAALPRADAAAVVRRPPECPIGELAVTEIERNVRDTAAARIGEFIPSRKLVKRAVCDELKSCLHVWGGAGADYTLPGSGVDSMTIGRFNPGTVPWAVCTPFQDGSQFALYLAGCAPLGIDGQPEIAHLGDYQKFTEIVVGLMEATRRTLRLAQQLEVARLAWPANLRRLFDDPDRLEELLRKPAVAKVTVLFCDLRGYSRLAEEKGDDLPGAFAEVQRALDVMSSAVTEKGGVVAGFRGDAVLGFWGWPKGEPDQIERAAEAALRIFERLSGPVMERKCGLGLTHGTALAGRLGAHDLAVVDLYGPVVNLAFRLEEMTKAFKVGIVISDEVANHLRKVDASGSRFRTRALGTVVPRGVKNPLTAYELASSLPVRHSTWVSGPNYAANLARWNAALKLFTDGSWAEAHEALGDLGNDPVAQYLMWYIEQPNKQKPANWAGTFTPKPRE
jgi:adenylate cyclase